MSVHDVITATLVAFGFVLWPIIGKWSEATGQWVISLCSLSTFGTATILSKNGLVGVPGTKPVILLLAAGIVNGAAVYAYAMKTSDPRITTSVFMVTVAVMMTLATSVVDWLLNGAIPNLRQSTGFAFGATAIYLLAR